MEVLLFVAIILLAAALFGLSVFWLRRHPDGMHLFRDTTLSKGTMTLDRNPDEPHQPGATS